MSAQEVNSGTPDHDEPPLKITFGETRSMGVRGVLIYWWRLHETTIFPMISGSADERDANKVIIAPD
jgi:hypothetical protein